jgi:hypothetical protein
VKVKQSRMVKSPILNKSVAWGYFEGACQGSPGSCRAWVILLLNEKRFISFKIQLGRGQTTELNFMLYGYYSKLLQKEGMKKLLL